GPRRPAAFGATTTGYRRDVHGHPHAALFERGCAADLGVRGARRGGIGRRRSPAGPDGQPGSRLDEGAALWSRPRGGLEGSRLLVRVPATALRHHRFAHVADPARSKACRSRRPDRARRIIPNGLNQSTYFVLFTCGRSELRETW